MPYVSYKINIFCFTINNANQKFWLCCCVVSCSLVSLWSPQWADPWLELCRWEPIQVWILYSAFVVELHFSAFFIFSLLCCVTMKFNNCSFSKKNNCTFTVDLLTCFLLKISRQGMFIMNQFHEPWQEPCSRD